MNLLFLRKKLTIIPQDPCLVKGTLRYNIDPINEYDNKEILNIIKQIGFDDEFSRDENYELNQILDYEIEEGGSNLSVGQKQVICIMRAFLRVSYILKYILIEIKNYHNG
jgi:ABC-type multidrug transport system fused ATPase/permease subunit